MSYVDAAINRLKDDAERKATTPPTPDAGDVKVVVGSATYWRINGSWGSNQVGHVLSDLLDHIATLTAQLAAANADAVSAGWLVWARKKAGAKRHLVVTKSGGLIPFDYRCSDAHFAESMREHGLTEWEMVRVSADPSDHKFCTPLVHVDVDAARTGAR